MSNSERRRKVRKFQTLLLQYYSDSSVDRDFNMTTWEYEELRNELLTDQIVGARIKRIVEDFPTLTEWINYRDLEYGMYLEVRIKAMFEPILALLMESSPVEVLLTKKIEDFKVATVFEFWRKILTRVDEDPTAALSAARGLLESVCKEVLRTENPDFDTNEELPKLYKETAKSLNLDVDQSNSDEFTKLARGCTSIVGAIGSIRNEFSDAHGKSITDPIVDKEHVRFAVTIAGATAVFLMERYERVSAPKQQNSELSDPLTMLTT